MEFTPAASVGEERERGNGKRLLMGTRVLQGKKKHTLESDGGDSHTL